MTQTYTVGYLSKIPFCHGETVGLGAFVAGVREMLPLLFAKVMAFPWPGGKGVSLQGPGSDYLHHLTPVFAR
jgi:hypothetical protein